MTKEIQGFFEKYYVFFEKLGFNHRVAQGLAQSFTVFFIKIMAFLAVKFFV